MIIILLITLFTASSAVWAAPPATITAAVKVDSARHVIIEGTISSGADQQVTLLVTAASGGFEHVDQTSSGVDGSFTFRYQLMKDATASYQAVIGGSGVEDPSRLTFTYTKSEGSSGPIVVPPANSNLESIVITGEQLRKAQDGLVVIAAPAGKREIILPLNASELLGTNKLQVTIEGIVLTMGPEVLKQLRLLPKDNNGIHISLKVKLWSDEETALQMRGSFGKGLSLQAAGAMAELNLSVKTKDGEMQLEQFVEPIRAQFPFQTEAASANLLGIYYYNPELKLWQYKGGKRNEASKSIEAELSHFSVYAVLLYEKTYMDMPSGHWAIEAVTVLSAKHVVQGMSETMFSPGTPVTRAQFAALLTRALGLQAGEAAPFDDVAAGSWYADAVAAAYGAGITNGVSSTLFGPDKPIKREEMAAMLARAFAKLDAGRNELATGRNFADNDDISGWAVAFVQDAVKSGLMQGTGNDRFLPRKHTTRAEAAQAIFNLMLKANL